MTLYQKIGAIGPKYFGKANMFKWGFNLSPMYRTSTARITAVSDDLFWVKAKLPISFRNRNYVGSIFGGSMFAAVDPIPMVQLINILGNDYVVWDKSAEIFFKIPAKEDLYAEFAYAPEEIDQIKRRVAQDGEHEIVKTTRLTSQDGQKTYCEVQKTIYIASKAHFKVKQQARRNRQKVQFDY